jgi:hypothetical protein
VAAVTEATTPYRLTEQQGMLVVLRPDGSACFRLGVADWHFAKQLVANLNGGGQSDRT